jgi:hypothetical protein
MHAFEVWNTLSPGLNHQILDSACLNNKRLYRQVVDDMASNLRRRNKALLDMPRAERHKLFQPLLGLPNFYVLTQNLVMNWLVADESEMLASFLDQLGIEHDGEGCVDMFPETMDDGKLKAAVDGLYAAFPEEKVTLYLNTFDDVSGCNWAGLKDLIRQPKAAVQS